MRFLALISSIYLLISCAGSKPLAMTQGQISQYKVMLEMPSNVQMSGIAMIRTHHGRSLGTMVNEFGIKILDFEINGTKCRLSNVIGPLDRWYIRQVVAMDLARIFGSDSKAQQDPDGLSYENKKRDIKYKFTII